MNFSPFLFRPAAHWNDIGREDLEEKQSSDQSCP
jgi:hypothetical protein